MADSTAADPVIVSVPDWLVTGWERPLAYAAVAITIGLAIQLVLTIVLLVMVQVLADFVEVDWGATLTSPFALFAGFHGTVGGIGLWLMGLLWIWVGLRWAADRTTVPALTTPRQLWQFSAKVAIPYAAIVATIGAVFRPDPIPLLDAGLSGALPRFGSTEWSVAAALFLALITSFVVTTVVMARKHGMPLARLVGADEISLPRQLTAAWAGAVRVLIISLPALLGLLVIGTLLEFVDSGLGFNTLVALLLSLLLGAVLWAGLDVAFVFMVSSMRLFTGAAFGTDPPIWTWAGVAIVGVAFFYGGQLAAQRLPAADGRQAVATGALVGAIVAMLMFVASWFAIGTGEALVGPALGLPILWSVASAAGGYFYASQHGLSMGITIETTRSNRGDEGDAD